MPTKSRKEKERIQHRKYMQDRSRKDPAFCPANAARTKAWRLAKIKRCPEWKRLTYLRSRKYKLHDSIASHLEIVKRHELELLKMVGEISQLEKFCCGK